MKAILNTTLLLLIVWPASMWAQAPAGFDFTPTPLSATIYGQAQIDGIPAATGDWVAAFDANGNCAGASALYVFEGAAYINLQIYGDDATTTNVDEGVGGGEAFALRLYDASQDTVLVYQSPLNPLTFDSWFNTNGAPLPGLDDTEAIFDWITVDVGFDVPTTHRCVQGEDIDLTAFAYPSNGTFAGPGVNEGVFSPSAAGVGTHVLSFSYSLATVYDTVEVYSFVVNLEGNDPLCFGAASGTLVPSAEGGFGSVEYEFGGANPLSAAAGDYSVLGTDELGCQATAEASLVDPELLTLSASSSDALCSGDATGNAEVTTSGGSGSIELDWGGADPSSLLAGDYQVTATDDNGCSASAAFSVNEPEPLQSQATVSSVLCAGGSSGVIGLETSGGTPPYTTDWMGENPAALLQGSYSVMVSDNNGCSITLTVDVDEPTGLSLAIQTTDVLCHGESTGSATLSVQGGTQPYSINWQGANPESLPAGSYSVVVNDENQCETSLSFDIGQPQPLAIELSTSDVACFGESTGEVSVSLSGGSGLLSWDLEGMDPTALEAGNYTVTASDENGCAASQDFQIIQNPLLTGSFSTANITCQGDGNGFASFAPSGGLAPYELNWIGVNPEALPGGLHHVQVSDAAGCSHLFTTQIIEPLPLTLTAVATRANCIDGTGAIGFAASGGTGTYIVDWSGLNLNAAPIGTHNYVVSDTNGCTKTGNVTVFPPLGECGCTESSAINYNPSATSNDGSCEFTDPCPADLSNDGIVGLQDLLVILSGYGLSCE